MRRGRLVDAIRSHPVLGIPNPVRLTLDQSGSSQTPGQGRAAADSLSPGDADRPTGGRGDRMPAGTWSDDGCYMGIRPDEQGLTRASTKCVLELAIDVDLPNRVRMAGRSDRIPQDCVCLPGIDPGRGQR